jgi:hypothetical protein
MAPQSCKPDPNRRQPVSYARDGEWLAAGWP